MYNKRIIRKLHSNNSFWWKCYHGAMVCSVFMSKKKKARKPSP